MSVSLGLADLKSVTEKPTHIVIYRADEQPTSSYSSDAIVKLLEEVRADCRRVKTTLDEMRADMERLKVAEKNSTPFLSATLSPEPVGLSVVRQLNLSPAVVPTPAADSKTVLSSLIDLHSAQAEASEEKDTDEDADDEDSEEDAEEGTEEEESGDEAMELEEFVVDGESYYRDNDGNVYQKDEDGDLDDTPIGTWDTENEKIILDISRLGYTEFEYKGHTYYRDEDNLVYQKDEDGDLIDEAVGVWNEEKQKVLKYAKAA
jgi:hypothetical protein